MNDNVMLHHVTALESERIQLQNEVARIKVLELLQI
jgi:hypothetical protein